MVETMKAGRLDATFMITPLAMKLREQGLRVKICYLGHRDGSTVMVRKNLPAKSLRDLRGKTFAIPSKYSNQNLVIHKLMEDQGVKPDEIRFVEGNQIGNSMNMHRGDYPRVMYFDPGWSLREVAPAASPSLPLTRPEWPRTLIDLASRAAAHCRRASLMRAQ